MVLVLSRLTIETWLRLSKKHHIPQSAYSCHTGISSDGQFVFEGHVPAKSIERFLKEKPEGAIGLAVPAMPIGSPGMEVGQKLQPYDVLLILRDGSTKVYEHIDSLQQQKAIN